jgi:hypothetical protein
MFLHWIYKQHHEVNLLMRLLHNSNSTLVDVFLAVEERLKEEQDNNDYENWHNTLSATQSTTIVSNAFTDVINELKEFTTPQIQKIHYNEMELAFNYDAKPLDQSYINSENSQVQYLKKLFLLFEICIIVNIIFSII